MQWVKDAQTIYDHSASKAEAPIYCDGRLVFPQLIVITWYTDQRSSNSDNAIKPPGARKLKEPLPLAREARLIIKEVDNEVLVYDLDTDKAHCLNRTAALIWKHCDGKKTPTQLRKLMEKETGSSVPNEVVWLALDQLEKFHLLDRSRAAQIHPAGRSRREVVLRIGIAAAALPVIISITAPTANAQASCSLAGQSCATRPCCPGMGLSCQNNNGSLICQQQ